MGSLTTLARVRERLQTPTAETDKDALINSLVTEVSDWIQSFLQRTIAQATYTEYQAGTDTPVLFLREGPVVSITSINTVVYEDGGGGTRQETLTLLDAFDYVPDNLQSEGALGRGILRRVDGGTFDSDSTGWRWKIVYVAGFTATPEAVTHLATTWVVHEYQNRGGRWNASRSVDDAQISLLSPAQLHREKDRILAPFVDHSGTF